MSYLQTVAVSHRAKVCSLYKSALRTLESWHEERYVFRYHAVLLRQRFDQNSKEKDMTIAKKMLEDGQEELFQNEHYQPKKFPHSPGGVAYARKAHTPDWVLDYWHPLEKAQYPEYFARREKRKKEYIAMWERMYGSPEQKPSH